MRSSTTRSTFTLKKSPEVSFHYALDRLKDGAVLRLEGRFLEQNTDSGLLDEMDQLLAGDVHKFVINLEKVEYLNSSGISIFVQLVSRVNRQGGNLVFARAPERIRTLLDVMKLNAVFDITETESAAKSQLNL